MISQVADGVDSELLGTIAPHHQCIGVIEPKGLGHADADFAKGTLDLLNVDLLTEFQYFLRDRAGVLRIGVDLSPAQCLPKNDGAAHSLSMLCRDTGIDQRLPCD